MKILIIQTAFIGDVILATPLIEKLKRFYPDARVDFLLRKGNESLLIGHPKINTIIIWDKQKNKFFNLINTISTIRKKKYDYVINIQRFASSGIITAFSGAKTTIGFNKNPFSFIFSQKVKHKIGVDGKQHEVQRNLSLIESFTDNSFEKPKLYPSKSDHFLVKEFQSYPYVCIAPTSVWFTKQFPSSQWIKLITLLLNGSWKNIANDQNNLKIYLIGAPNDYSACETIKLNFSSNQVINLAGKLTLLQTASLMSKAQMNFVNDSAPLHICSAMNANTTAIFCSTVSEFGFGPLSDNHTVIELDQPLYCRPCGLHGFKTCPEKHFRCAFEINLELFSNSV